MNMNNKVYDFLKYIAQVVLPAIITLTATIEATTGYDYETAMAILGAINVFLGSCLFGARKQWKAENEPQPAPQPITKGM